MSAAGSRHTGAPTGGWPLDHPCAAAISDSVASGRIQGNRHEETDRCGGARRHVDLRRSTSSGPRRKCRARRGFGIGRVWTGRRGRRWRGRVYGRTCDRQFLGNQATAVQGPACSTISPSHETTGCRARSRATGCPDCASSRPDQRNGCQHKSPAADSDI
jgi:hypothetical protein